MAPVATPKSSTSVVPKACESCRTRKIRCNRVIPCSNCLSSGISCRPAKAVEHRPRILVSNNYEKQIELISERLAAIEHSIKNISISSPKFKESPRSQDDHVSLAGETTPAPVQFEGLSSFVQQSMQATEMAETLGGKSTIELSSAIKSLRDLLHVQPEMPGIGNQLFVSDTRMKMPEVELLPSAFVIVALKKMREKTPISFMSSALRDPDALERICQRAYFPTEQLTIGEQTSMFGIFYNLIQEYLVFKDPITDEFDCSAFADICRKNFFAGIETYEMLTVPSYWNVVSLLLGAMLAADDRRSSLSWNLCATASRHAQALGYHREATVKQDEPEVADRKRYLFWTLYSMDRSLALSLGRPPCLPDYDIDLKYFEISNNPGIHPWDYTTLIFTKIGYVQGQIYEQLYSASASQKSNAERGAIIEHLSALLEKHQTELRGIDVSKAYFPEMLEMMITPTEIIYYSLLTSLHRAAFKPEAGPEVSSKCFEFAQKALELHLIAFPRFSSAGDFMMGAYVNWVLLYSSFTPFVVVFLHAIASHSMSDVELIEKVAASLEKPRTMADDIERLYQTCLVFCRVAKTIIESRHNLVGTYNETDNSFVFPDLTTQQPMYGHNNVPDFFVQESGIPPTSNDIGEMSMFFGNWMGGNQPVMDLLNMDLTGDVE